MDAMSRSSTERMLSRPPSLSLSGVITRSKYQLRHHNPTGHFQSSSPACGSDSVNYYSDDDEDHMLDCDLWKKAKLNQESSVEHDVEPSQILIMDLRARRVYSPQSVGGTFSYSSPNVDPTEAKVGSRCRDLEMVDSGSGSASIAENNDSAEVPKRDGMIDSLCARLPSESRNKDEINSILSSIAKEYRSEKDGYLHSDGALKTTNKETESPVVGFPYKDQNMGHLNHESVGDDGQQLKCFSGCYDGTCAFERLDNADGLPELMTPPDDIETCGKVKVDEGGGKQVGAIHITDTRLTVNTNGKEGESLCPNAGDKNDSLKRKHVRISNPIINFIF